MGRVTEKLRGVTCGAEAAAPPPPNPDPWVRGHPFGDFISSSLLRGPSLLNPLVVAPFSLLLQISSGCGLNTLPDVHIGRLPWAGMVRRGGVLFKESWTCIVLWPDTCLVELTESYVQVAKSYVQFQSLMFSSKSLMFSSESLMFSSTSLMLSSKSLMLSSQSLIYVRRGPL